jgi:hypothetical protein
MNKFNNSYLNFCCGSEKCCRHYEKHETKNSCKWSIYRDDYSSCECKEARIDRLKIELYAITGLKPVLSDVTLNR